MREFKYNMVSAIAVVIVILLCHTLAICKSDAEAFQVQNGLVTIKQNNVSLLDLLEQIAKRMDMQIYITSQIDPATRISPNYDKVAPEALIQSLLKNYSYALIYNASQLNDPRESRIWFADRNHPRQSLADANNVNNAAATEISDRAAVAPHQEDRIMVEIEALKKRIDSGISDREYEQWKKIRGPRFATHDRDRLAAYRKQLETSGSD
jgi:hypothetical protein